MQLVRRSRPEDVARQAADTVARVVTARPGARIVLPAGATPVPLFAELVRRCASGEADLRRAHLFQLDELVGVAPEDPRSFHAFLKAHLLGHLDRPPDRDHMLDGAAGSPADEIARHAGELAALGDADLVILGLGRNGHVAFNEPGSEAMDGARVVPLHPTTVTAMEAVFGAGEAPRRGLTLGLAEILAASELLLIVTGASKAAILGRLLGARPGPTPDPGLPASLLLEHPGLTIVGDDAAFAECER